MLRNVKGKIRGVREDLTRGTLFEEDGFDYNGNWYISHKFKKADGRQNIPENIYVVVMSWHTFDGT